MADEDERLRALFLEGGNRWVAEKLRQRVIQGRPLEGTLVKEPAEPEERRALDDLLGRRSSRSQSLRLPLRTLRDRLREAGLIGELEDVVRVCFGDVVNRRVERSERAARWDVVFAEGRAAMSGKDGGRDWIDSLEADGLLKRLAGSDPEQGGTLLRLAIAVWRRLPGDGIPLAELAGELTGDTHALDRGRPLSALLLRGLKLRVGIDGNAGGEERRRAWESAGVVVDRLSAPALTFQLCAAAEHPLGGILESHAGAGWPAFVPYQALAGENPFLPRPAGLDAVFVVENPALIEAAVSRLGSLCRPLVCTEGIPKSSVRRLLALLVEAGIKVRARADFDWTGLRIVDGLIRDFGAEPWRMDAETYGSGPDGVPLGEGSGVEAVWGGELAGAMQERGVAVYEETLAEVLLADLKR